jgi:hypothetical protein
MATEILSLADFTVSTGTDGGTGDFVQKAFTGKTQIWSSWQFGSAFGFNSICS